MMVMVTATNDDGTSNSNSNSKRQGAYMAVVHITHAVMQYPHINHSGCYSANTLIMCLRVGHLKNYINININKLVTTKASACTQNTNTKSFAGILSPITHSMILFKVKEKACIAMRYTYEWVRNGKRDKIKEVEHEDGDEETREKECKSRTLQQLTWSYSHKLHIWLRVHVQ